MMQRVFAIGSLVLATGLWMVPPVQAQPASTTVQPGPWQPIARINPRQPVQIQMVNQTNTTLEYGLTTNEAPPRRLAAGATASLTRVVAPAYLLINPLAPEISLKYTVSANGNAITVVIQRMTGDAPGNTTLNVHEGGGIYVY